jgi:hypothetical protein
MPEQKMLHPLGSNRAWATQESEENSDDCDVVGSFFFPEATLVHLAF